MTSDREADVIAVQFNAMGFHAAILRYSVAPAEYPTALLEVGNSLVHIRRNARKWHVDADKITITMKNYFIVEAQNALIVHIVLMVLTTVSVILEPLIAKLLRRVNTSVAIEENAKIEAIDISDED